MEEYVKNYFLMLAKKHPIVLFSFLIACFGVLNSTALFSLYPEVFSNNLSTEQLFLVCFVFTSLLAFIYIASGLFFCLERSSWSQLSNADKRAAGLIEFYIPATFFILICGFSSFEVHTLWYKYVVVLCGILGVIVILCLYKRYSWPLRDITVYKKGEITFLDYLGQRVLIPTFSGFIGSCFILVIFINKTELINFFSHQLNGYLTFAITVLLSLLPSYIIYVYRNIKSIVLSFAMACIILTLFIPSKFSPTRRWLSENHIAYFNDYIFNLKKKGCHSLNLAGVQLQQLRNGACKIAALLK